MDFKFDLQQTHFLHTIQIPWSFEDYCLGKQHNNLDL
jgi:hypothetical protein